MSFKIRNYVKVKKIIESYPDEITSGSQLKNIKGIGKSTIARIDEILDSGTLAELPTPDDGATHNNIVEEEKEKNFLPSPV